MKLTRLLLEADYTHIGYGKYKEKGKEKDSNAPTFKKDDSGKFVPISAHAAAAKDADSKKDTPKVNIFNNPSSDISKYKVGNGPLEKNPEVWVDGKFSKAIDKLKNSQLTIPNVAKLANKFGVDVEDALKFVSYDRVVDLGVSDSPSKEEPKTSKRKWIAYDKDHSMDSESGMIVPRGKESDNPDSKDIKGFDKLDSPKSEPSKPKRQGNPQVNKATLSKAEKLGITPQKLGKEEYQKKMAQAAIEALTDSNYHTEARELVAKLEGKPEMAERPVYPSMKDPKFKEKMAAIRTKYASEYTDNVGEDASELGTSASQEAGWGGVEAADSIAFTLRMNGFHKLADTIQSVFDDKPYMKGEGKISLNKIVKESFINEGTRSQVGVIKGGKIISVYVHFDGYPSNMKPGLQKHMKDEKDVMTLIKKGGARGIYDDKDIEYYGNMKPMKGDMAHIDDYVRNAGNEASADYVYLYNTSDKKWYYAKTYDDTKLKKL